MPICMLVELFLSLLLFMIWIYPASFSLNFLDLWFGLSLILKKNAVVISSNISCALFSLSLILLVSITCVSDHLIFRHCSCTFCSDFAVWEGTLILLFVCQLGKFLLIYLQVNWFFGYAKFIKGILYLHYYLLFLTSV